ncbi:hypothetical protein Taro_049720 [Colocasia esculenta]|uniref:Uncharacterized protein n=1 Tax=Colocasia esculenta TaxID=4460 RepID=A0A843XBW2_COLES|nr:hypothetical protein [Colocasia esculenta]
MRKSWPPIHTYRLHRKGGSRHRQGLQPHNLQMYIHRHQLHKQELQSHNLYIHKQGLHNQEGYTHLVPYQMPQTSLSMQPSVLRLLGVHLQLLQHHFTFLRSPAIDADILRHMGEMQRKQRSLVKRKDQMTQLMNLTPSEESDGTTHLPVLTPEEAFRQVFGRDRPGRIRCGGRGQTSRSWYGPSKGGSSSNTTYQRLLEEQSQQKSEIERMKKIIEDQEQRITA